MRFYFLLAALVWLLTAASAPARDIFVDNLAGDDRRAGSQPWPQGELGPCLTIGKALRIAQSSDRIVVANTGAPYRECLTLQAARHSGSDSRPFTLQGNGAVLDGSVSLAEAVWEYAGNDTFRTRPRWMSFQQLFLNGVPVRRVAASPAALAALQPLEWSLDRGWIYFRVEPGKLPQSYDLSCCGEKVGITLYEVHDVVIEDLAIRGYHLDGVNCHDNVWRTDLVRLTTEYNGRSGISVGGASRVRVDTCRSAGNGAAQFRQEGYSIVELLDNDLDPTSAPDIIRQGGKLTDGRAPAADVP